MKRTRGAETRHGRAALLAGTLVLTLAGFPALAASPAVGTATTASKILELVTNDTVEVGVVRGIATTDAGRHRPVTQAGVAFRGARAGESETEETQAEAYHDDDPSTPESDGASGFPPVDFSLPSDGSLVDGSLQIGALSAEAPDPLTALAHLSEVVLDADLSSGLVVAEGVGLDLSQTSRTVEAAASQRLSIDRLEVVPFSRLLDLQSLSLDDLVRLADIVDESGGLSDAVGDAKADLLSTVNSLLPSPAQLPSDVSLVTLLATAAGLIEDEEELSPLCPEVTQDACVVAALLDPLITALEGALDALEDELGELVLLTLEGLEAAVDAYADDDSAEGNWSLLDLGTVTVAGQTVADPGDLTDYIVAIDSALETLVGALRTVPGLENLTADLSGPSGSSQPAALSEDAYQTGSASMIALSFSLDTGEGASIPMAMELRVLALEAFAEHLPPGSIDDDSDPNGDDSDPNDDDDDSDSGPGVPNSGGGGPVFGRPPLAATGPGGFAALAIALLTMSARLAAWLKRG
jgi:hypothetical protein